MIRHTAYTILILLIGTSHAAAETTWQLAPGRTKIAFNVKHLVFMDVKGKFKAFEGSVSAPEGTLENARMRVKIDARSIYTGIDDRDRHLIGEEFFHTEKYPEIIFESSAVHKTSESPERYQINGNLTIRGVSRPIVLDAECTGKKTLSNGSTRLDLRASGQLNRFDYGLRWNELMETGKAIVGEDVNLTLKIALLSQSH